MLKVSLSQLLSAVAICALSVSFSSAAQSSHEQGLTISKERKARDLGWQDSTAEMTMVLRNAQGDESERAMRTKALEVEGDGDKALTRR